MRISTNQVEFRATPFKPPEQIKYVKTTEQIIGRRCFNFTAYEEVYQISRYGRGYFIDEYDREPRDGPNGEVGRFRHYCLRGQIIDYDLGAPLIDNVHSYEVIGHGGDLDDNSYFDPFNEITWWFYPTTTAMDEVLSSAENGSLAYGDGSFVAPTSGKIRIYLYIEMHLDFYYNIIYGGPTHIPHRVTLGPETDSIPCLRQVCYTRLSS